MEEKEEEKMMKDEFLTWWLMPQLKIIHLIPVNRFNRMMPYF